MPLTPAYVVTSGVDQCSTCLAISSLSGFASGTLGAKTYPQEVRQATGLTMKTSVSAFDQRMTAVKIFSVVKIYFMCM